MTKGLFAGILELGLDRGPFKFEDVPGVLRLEATGKVLEDGADPVGATLTLTWGTGSFSKVAAVNKDVKGEGGTAVEAPADVSAEAEGSGTFLPEPALGSTVPSAAKRTGEAPERTAGSVGAEGAVSCRQVPGACRWVREATTAAAPGGFSLSFVSCPTAAEGASVRAGEGTLARAPPPAAAGGPEGACCSCAPETRGGCAWSGLLVSDWG